MQPSRDAGATRRVAALAARPVRRESLNVGRLGEELAAAHLRRLGFSILARNVRTRHGEIDLIAFDGSTLTFVEVKARRARPGAPRPARPSDPPLERLGRRQQLRLRKMAVAWLYGRARPRFRPETIRFDAVAVLVDDAGELLRLDHLEGAW